MTQHSRSLRHTVPFNNVATAYTACHNLKQNLFVADFGDGHFFNANVMVVVVDGGKQEASPRKDAGLSLACYYLIKQVKCFLRSIVIMDNGSNCPDCGY